MSNRQQRNFQLDTTYRLQYAKWVLGLKPPNRAAIDDAIRLLEEDAAGRAATIKKEEEKGKKPLDSRRSTVLHLKALIRALTSIRH